MYVIKSDEASPTTVREEFANINNDGQSEKNA